MADGLFAHVGGDAVSWGCFLGALAATASAWVMGRRGRFVLAALLLATAGILLRTNLSYRFWLSDWDERYHAVVGRNAIDEPFVPSVVPDRFDDITVRDWGRAEVWLHKPPVATWLIGASLATFGETEPAVRIPSVLFSGLGIFLTFLIGRRLLGAPVGLGAAAIFAWHARLGQLAGGLRATDHVDHQFVVLVTLGVWLALRAGDALAASPRGARGWVETVLCGLVLGVAILTKSLPALVIAGVLGLALLVGRAPWPVRVGAPALVVAIGWLVQLPWDLWVHRAFPEHAAYYDARNARYFTEVVAGQSGPPWFYLGDMAEYFGVLAPVAVASMLWQRRRDRALWPAFGWLLATYGVFSLSRTKMTGYVFIAAPMVMIAMAWLWNEAWSDRLTGRRRAAWRALAVGMAVAFVVGSAIRVYRPWSPPMRRPAWADELRYFGARVTALGPGRWLVFNTPSVSEARFYTRAVLVRRKPDAEDLERAAREGYRVAVYGEPGVAAPVRDDVTFVPRDPRTAAQRRILEQLPRPEWGTEIWLWNARDPKPLEEYLERFVPLDARTRIPDAADFDRVERAGGIAAILVAPGAPDPPLPPGRAWLRVESPEYVADRGEAAP